MYLVGSILVLLSLDSLINQSGPLSILEETKALAPSAILDEITEGNTAPEKLDAIAALVSAQINSSANPSTNQISLLEEDSEAVFISLRANGVEYSNRWTEPGTLHEKLSDGIAMAAIGLSQEDRESIDSVELCLSANYQKINPNQLPSNVDRGVLGLRVRYQDSLYILSPTEMIAKNFGFTNALNSILEQLQISEAQLTEDGRTEIFECEQIMVFLDSTPRAERMLRGNQLVPIEAVDFDSMEDFAELASAWLVSQIHEDGRMTYKYWPSRGEESEANNMIRQWMASVAIDRIIEVYGDQSTIELGRKNIDYNLSHFYLEEESLGLIDWNDNVKLGAISIAALALSDHPDSADFSQEIEALLATTKYLWREDVSFETFYRPESRSGENQNFYPGETLVYWSELYKQTGDQELLHMFMQSFDYYREWHRENINPAFIPWHTQAYYTVWKMTDDEELKNFIFEMNDWLIDFQEIEKSIYADTQGRFYDSDRPQYGVPHASSTGVYLEGLVDAFLLAKEVGDEQRQEKYGRAIRYAIRSLMQLQYVDEIDMYYISQRDNVLGGLRTTVYDNSIRVDNVQHGLMGILKIIQNPAAQAIFD
jgi:hypothetical protein